MLTPRAARIVTALCRPIVGVRAFLKAFPVGSFEFRLALEAFARPWYAHGVYHAAELAQRLEMSEITVAEFGVATGNGLRELERVAIEVEQVFGVRIHVVGFDTGVGLPGSQDYRDLPYVWQKGFYRMDVQRVQSKLKRARLILGDVRETVPPFLEQLSAPLGFISFDLDFYTSTASAFRIFSSEDRCYLPRVFLYFDDISADGQMVPSCDVGELLAIEEFNRSEESWHRIRPTHNLGGSYSFRPAWANLIWVYHRYQHPDYNRYIGKPKPRQETDR